MEDIPLPRFINDPDAKRQYMLNTPVPKLVLTMAIPTMMSMLVQSIYNLADTYFVSGLGDSATAAVGINASLENIIMMAGSFLAMGAASYISRLLGAKDDKKASQTLSTAFFCAVTLGILVMLFGQIFKEQLVGILGAKGDVVDYAKQYADYVLLAAPFMAASFVLNQGLRAEGSSIFSMIGMVTGTVINIILDPIFINTLDMGIQGASLATAISKFISFSILLVPYLRKKTSLRINPKLIRFKKDIIAEISKMGAPGLLRSGSQTIAIIFLNNVAGNYGSDVLAAVSVSNRIMTFLVFACLGFSQGFQPVAGYCWGAKRYDRIQIAYKFASKAAILGISVLSVALIAFAEPLIGVFTTNETTLKLGVFALRVQCLVMPVHAWTIIVNMLCTGIGKPIQSLILSISRQGICFIPLLPLFVLLFKEYGVASIQAAADFLSFIIAIPIAAQVMRGIRKKDEEQRLEQGKSNDSSKLEVPANET